MDIRQDLDPVETQEWIDSLKAVLQHRGPERAQYILQRMVDEARRSGAYLPYLDDHRVHEHDPAESARRSRRAISISSTASGQRSAGTPCRSSCNANKESSELGGHIASFQSAAVLYEIGFNHFWHAPTKDHGGDMIYFQGHCGAGHLRPCVPGRPPYRGAAAQVSRGDRRQGHILVSPSVAHARVLAVPHGVHGPRPLMAIYQARFLKYLEGRGLAQDRRTQGLGVPGRRRMRRAGIPGRDLARRGASISTTSSSSSTATCSASMVRCAGNGKIIQELESVFRGAGWNVIKVVWGSGWDKLFAKDKDGILLRRMEECVDGQYQDFKSKDGAYVREHFFNTPELKAMVADLTDEQVWKLNRGGHDPAKVYAAYAAAVKHKGQPTLILPKTVKGFGMGESGEGQMIAHQAKKMTAGVAEEIPRPLSDSGARRQDRGAAVPHVPRGQPGDEIPA